ncbi:hypothetical protein FPZ43_15290 [Mucilaginibacter pallidiroseus]|uniref:Lipoprotein n=1 Tax=Mucilaginibacter pallidiroseus TaxID=2599295 RepID=A0A563U5A1_9SPHI|nr:hypothetical protein [Mucilaginibacter pallidiroseus]TWR26517.1 hypothetical protein FPZ43_15290 [Mucilaginibacter pallidiroseus]
MRKIYAVILMVVAVTSACKKENAGNEIIVDPPVIRIISKDTITTGAFWGLAIGQTATNIYATLQAMQPEKKMSEIGIVGNVFDQLERVENRLPLYKSILLDHAVGSSAGIQIYFTNDKVSSIYTNNGAKLNRWPGNTGNEASITTGEAISGVYAKLYNIRKNPGFTALFERVSMFSKDIVKPYDDLMAQSPEWYFVSPGEGKRYTQVQMKFTAGKLTAIYVTVFE